MCIWLCWKPGQWLSKSEILNDNRCIRAITMPCHACMRGCSEFPDGPASKISHGRGDTGDGGTTETLKCSGGHGHRQVSPLRQGTFRGETATSCAYPWGHGKHKGHPARFAWNGWLWIQWPAVNWLSMLWRNSKLTASSNMKLLMPTPEWRTRSDRKVAHNESNAWRFLQRLRRKSRADEEIKGHTSNFDGTLWVLQP